MRLSMSIRKLYFTHDFLETMELIPQRRFFGNSQRNTASRVVCAMFEHIIIKNGIDEYEKTSVAGLRRSKVTPITPDAEFLVDRMGYLTALAKTDLTGDLNYSDRNIVEKLFQTFTMRIERFHETWNGSQPSAERWLTAYTAYYNHHRSHQALENQTPINALKLEGSI